MQNIKERIICTEAFMLLLYLTRLDPLIPVNLLQEVILSTNWHFLKLRLFEKFWVHSKIEGQVQRFTIYPLSPQLGSLHVQHLHQTYWCISYN